MRVTLHNLQNPDDVLNGSHVEDADRLRVVLDELQLREPFILELEGGNGFRLTIGIGGPVGCAQFASSSGESPYLVAVTQQHQLPVNPREYVFLCGNQETTMPAYHCVPYPVLRFVAAAFLQTGGRSPEVNWVEV